jgi:hypothetical protein
MADDHPMITRLSRSWIPPYRGTGPLFALIAAAADRK